MLNDVEKILNEELDNSNTPSQAREEYLERQSSYVDALNEERLSIQNNNRGVYYEYY